jgi:hypothetical protein
MDALALLQRLGQGRLIAELADALVSVADEVVATGKDGAVTLTLKLSTREQGDVMVQVDEKIARKTPSRSSRGALLYAVHGELHAQDPRQTRMNFREVDRPTADQRELDDAAPTVREA